MTYECECGWKFVGSDDTEQLLARIDHVKEHHTSDVEQEFHGDNLDLIEIVHEALHLIDDDDLDGWYTSQIERMRTDADEIIKYQG
ncbi:hypothetical protein [Natronoarchaeum rubrum]|uniref:hypothetical protein n=1 Tax=Natronoarchaeum rubrum TaxID=755311 RepID=UPI002111E974|nr:hypothetical protein [Natronoarchaeum rubrum]